MTKLSLSSSSALSGLFIPAIVVVAGLVGYFLVLPSYHKMKDASDMLAEKQANIKLQETSLQQIKNLIENAKAQGDQLKPVDEALPDSPRVPELLANFDELGAKSGVLISDVNITLPAPTEAGTKGIPSLSKGERVDTLVAETNDLGIMQVNMNVSGTYSNMKGFIANLEQNLRFIDVVSLTASKSSNDLNSQQYVLTLNAYFQK